MMFFYPPQSLISICLLGRLFNENCHQEKSCFWRWFNWFLKFSLGILYDLLVCYCLLTFQSYFFIHTWKRVDIREMHIVTWLNFLGLHGLLQKAHHKCLIKYARCCQLWQKYIPKCNKYSKVWQLLSSVGQRRKHLNKYT